MFRADGCRPHSLCSWNHARANGALLKPKPVEATLLSSRESKSEVRAWSLSVVCLSSVFLEPA